MNTERERFDSWMAHRDDKKDETLWMIPRCLQMATRLIPRADPACAEWWARYESERMWEQDGPGRQGFAWRTNEEWWSLACALKDAVRLISARHGTHKMSIDTGDGTLMPPPMDATPWYGYVEMIDEHSWNSRANRDRPDGT